MSATARERTFAALSYSMKGAVEATGLSEATLDRAIRSGALRTKRSSVNADGDPVGARVILASQLAAWLESLPDG